jgi:hypothetical protein
MYIYTTNSDLFLYSNLSCSVEIYNKYNTAFLYVYGRFLATENLTIDIER